MYFKIIITTLLATNNIVNCDRESAINFRVEAGTRTCFYERGEADQMLELQYQVIDGQHGDLDINFEIKNPKGEPLSQDYKKPQNSILMDLEQDGDYEFCMDNTFSVINSKLVFVYMLMEDKIDFRNVTDSIKVSEGENVTVEHENGTLHWMGVMEEGDTYFIDVVDIIESITKILKHVVRSRHLMDMYAAVKSRDSYLAFEETFVVDVWSIAQITVMIIVGMTQVFMIKKLFNKPIIQVHSYL